MTNIEKLQILQNITSFFESLRSIGHFYPGLIINKSYPVGTYRSTLIEDQLRLKNQSKENHSENLLKCFYTFNRKYQSYECTFQTPFLCIKDIGGIPHILSGHFFFYKDMFLMNTLGYVGLSKG